MFNRKTSFVSSILLFSAAVCFAQSSGSQTVNVPQGSSLKLRASSVNAVAFQWIKDGTAIAGATSPDYHVLLAGTYTVISFNTQGCASDISDPVLVVMGSGVLLTADVMINKKSELRSVGLNDPFIYLLKVKNNGAAVANQVKVTDVLPEELSLEQLLTPSAGTVAYNINTRTVLWEIDKMNNGESAELKIKVKTIKGGTIKNTASVSASESDPDLNNNSSTDEKQIAGIFIPNVITPNGDGKNDTFIITGLNSSPDNDLTILNRWGSTVYERRNYKNDWNGEGLNEGTYFYLFKVRTAQGKLEVYKGYITLLRNKSN